MNSRHPAPKAGALPTALHPDMKFSNCGQTCGQGHFLTSYRRGGKCCQPLCPKAFRDFQGRRPEPRRPAPKAGALPTALHPVIQFSLHDTMRRRKKQVFRVCGRRCGQARFCESFFNWGISAASYCPKGFRVFAFRKMDRVSILPKRQAHYQLC